MTDSPATPNFYQLAIDAALDSRWEDALKINKKIIKEDPKNIDALNRQAKAYMELGKANLAKKYYSEVLKFDPYNPIAIKNIKIMKSCKSQDRIVSPCNGKDKLSAALFLQEPGKTKIVSLLKVAEPQKLSQASCGMRVEMVIKNRKITIVDSNSNYLGVMPDDVSHRLLRLFKGGNKYDLFVKSIRVNSLTVLVKETFRSKRFKNQPSFLEYSESSVSTNLIPLDNNDDDEDENNDEEQEI